MSKLIYVHYASFHADEVSAIALLKVFKPDDYEVKRVDHQTIEFPDADYVIDTGRIYDNKTRFDHHQWEGGLSSAGLIWKHLNVQDDYPEISKLVKAIDDNDVGVKPAAAFEYSRLISMFNQADTYGDSQRQAFDKALDFAVNIFTNMRDRQTAYTASGTVCANAPFWPGTTDVLNLGTYQPGWSDYVNGVTRPDIEAVTWFDTHLGTWNIQTTNVSPSSYEKVGKTLLPYDKMDFVHANNFFAVASTEELMADYIKNFRG